jgi:hypothetical protein
MEVTPMKIKFLSIGLIIAILSLSMLGACTGTTANDSKTITSTKIGTTTATGTTVAYAAGEGKIQIYVTDAPAENITAIVIQANTIEIHRAGDTEGEWITLLENPPAFDLLQVAGIQSLLGSANVTSGNYTQVRVGISEVTVTINGENKTATVPSGKLKFVGHITVTEGQTTSISFDFDAGKSIIVKGNGSVSMKPVVKLLIGKPGGTLETPATGTLTPTDPL